MNDKAFLGAGMKFPPQMSHGGKAERAPFGKLSGKILLVKGERSVPDQVLRDGELFLQEGFAIRFFPCGQAEQPCKRCR